MPRKKASTDLPVQGGEAVPAEPSDAYTSRELWRCINFYCKNIRNHPPEEYKGVIRNIQRMIDKGIGLEMIATALENYMNDEWRKANPAYSKPIRSFFTKEIIEEWQHPRPSIKKPDPVQINFTPLFRPSPVTVEPKPEELDDL